LGQSTRASRSAVSTVSESAGTVLTKSKAPTLTLYALCKLLERDCRVGFDEDFDDEGSVPVPGSDGLEEARGAHTVQSIDSQYYTSLSWRKRETVRSVIVDCEFGKEGVAASRRSATAGGRSRCCSRGSLRLRHSCAHLSRGRARGRCDRRRTSAVGLHESDSLSLPLYSI
jgi:hypothetical protein